MSFGFDVKLLTAGTSSGKVTDPFLETPVEDMASATRFAAGETKRFVADFRVGDHGFLAMLPGTYVFTGYYNGHSGPPASEPDTVTRAVMAKHCAAGALDPRLPLARSRARRQDPQSCARSAA